MHSRKRIATENDTSGKRILLSNESISWRISSNYLFLRFLPLPRPMESRLSLRTVAMSLLQLSSAMLVFCLFVSSADAATRYWVGGVSDRWETTDNWSALPRGAGGATVPTSADVAVLSFSGGTVRLRSAVNVQGILLSNVWTGSLLQGSGTIQVGSTGFRVGSGSFAGCDATIRIGATGSGFTMTGGIVRGIMNNMTMSGSFKMQTGGSYVPTFTATGTIILDGAADQSFTRESGTMKLGSLTLQNTGGGTSDDIIVKNSAGLNMSGSIVVTTGNLDLSTNSVDLVIRGHITVADAAQATFATAGNVTASGSISVGTTGSFSMAGSKTLTLNGTDQNIDTNNSSIYNITIGVSSGATLTSNEQVTGTLQINTGATLAMGVYSFGATGATILNYGTIAEDTGKLVYRVGTTKITNDSYVEVDDIKTGNAVYMTLTDSDENISGTAIDTVTVTLSATTGDSESITLYETSKTSGIFRSSINTENAAYSTNNGTMQTTADAYLTLSYTDAQDGLTGVDLANFTALSGSATASSGTSGGGGTRGGGGGGRAPAATVAKPTVKKPTVKKSVITRVKKSNNAAARREARLKKANIRPAVVKSAPASIKKMSSNAAARRAARLSKQK